MENGRKETLARLMEEHGDRLYRLCLLLLRDPHLVEDAVQDTMLKAWRGLDSFEARASEKIWLTAIAVNVCRDYRRLYWYRKRLDGEALLEQIPAPPDAEPQDDEILRQVLVLAPKYREAIIGHAEVRQVYKVSKIGTVCGCYVTDGKIVRNCDVRVNRDNIVIHEGHLASLRRFKDDVKEVASGYECGMQVEKFNDIKEGDVIECFVMEEVKQ